MVPSILLAVMIPAAPIPGAPFADPVGNADLAGVHGAPVRAEESADLARWSALGRTPAIVEQVDNWWADDGLMLIAAAVRPLPVAGSLPDLSALAEGSLTFRYQQTVSTGR